MSLLILHNKFQSTNLVVMFSIIVKNNFGVNVSIDFDNFFTVFIVILLLSTL